MANHISTKTASTALAPPSATRELSLTVARLHNAVRFSTWNRSEIDAARAPSDDERAALDRRLGEIDAALRPGEPRSILAAVSGMFLGFAGTDSGIAPEDVLARAQVYVEAVAGQPLWAVHAACRAWRDGRHGRGAFVPSTAQFAPTVTAEAMPLREERHRINAILSAKIIGPDDPEARARCYAMGMEAAAKMRTAHFRQKERAAVGTLDALLAEACPDMTDEARAAVIEGIQRGKGRA